MHRHLCILALVIMADCLMPTLARADGSFVVGMMPDRRRSLTITHNHRSTDEANTAALAACRRAGAADCAVLATFRNQCYASAVTRISNGFGANPGRDIPAAQAAALSECNTYSPGLGCYILQVQCDTIDAVLESKARQRQEAQAEQARQRQQEHDQFERERQRAELRRQQDLREQQALEQREWRRAQDQAAKAERERQERAQEEQRKQADYADALAACERYELEACHRISRVPLVVPGLGMAESLDRISRQNMRFNRALADAQTFGTYVNECDAKKRIACDSALVMPGITSAQLVRIEQMQAALPWFNLNDPRHFIATMIGLPIFGYFAFFVLARRSPAGASGLSGDKQPRALDRFMYALRQHVANFDATSISKLRLRIAASIAPGVQFTEGPSSSTTKVEQAIPDEPPRDPTTAQAALTLAYSYLCELPDQLASEIIDNPETAPSYRSTLALAAKQLDAAQRADATAKLTIEDGDAPPEVVSQQWLRARTLQLEALTWCVQDPRQEIRLLTQATQVDPSYRPAHHSLGAAHFLSRNRGQAISALQKALALDPTDIETIKLLDRARNMSDAEIATYRLSNAASKTAAAGIKTWNVMRLVWIFGLPIAIVLIVAQFTGSMSSSVGAIFSFFVLGAVFTGLRRLKQWFDTY